MIILKSREEVELMRAAGRIASQVIELVGDHVRDGVTTAELDEMAEEFILKNGATPAFKGYRGYRYALCTSINEEVVHGLPGPRKIKSGDIIGVDVGVKFKGFYGDIAKTFAVGDVGDDAKRLLKVTEESLFKGIDKARAGLRLFDISHAIQEHVEAAGFSVVRDFVGHGIGTSLHEDPQIPNFGEAGTGVKLRPGMVFALEPMVNAGDYKVRVLNDSWTVITADMSLSAHFEHTIAITDGDPVILSSIK